MATDVPLWLLFDANVNTDQMLIYLLVSYSLVGTCRLLINV